MAFSQSTIIAVNPPQYWGAQVYLSWISSSPPGTWFQIYINQALAWYGQSTSTRLPVPPVGVERLDLGTVLPGEEQTSFAGSLPTPPNRRAELSWLGGTFEGTDIAGFRVFGSPTAGGMISYISPLADITAYPSGILTDGFGLGGFGGGAFGESASTYSWTSGSLTGGVWPYAVIPYDAAGNLGTPALTSITVTVPPLAPADFPDGLRLHYTYDPGTFEVTLNWMASPG